MTFFMDLLVSIGCIIFTLSISQFFREFCREKWPKDLFGSLIMEFIAAFELTAVVYELSIILGIGGVPLYAMFLFGIWYWRTNNWHRVSATPCAYFEEWAAGKMAPLAVFFVVLVQLAGGLLTYRYYTKLYWSIGLSSEHTSRLHEGFQCTSDIRAVPIYAAFIECIGVFISSFVAKLLAKVKYLDGVAGLINAFLGTCLVLAAFNISGGYMNPMLASTIQFGCSGSTLLEHFQVYWVAATVGTFLAHYLDTGLTRLFSSNRKAPLVDGQGQKLAKKID